MNLKQTLLILGAVSVGALLLLVSNNINHPVLGNYTEAQNNWETKVDAQGNVTVTATPLTLSSEVSEWKFDIGLNTHSLELDQDMTKVAVLVDDSGNVYVPVRWEGAPVGGHHREGALVFRAIWPLPKSVELKIMNVDAPIRSFVWNITN